MKQFSVTGTDQFGQPIANPPMATWTLTGLGSLTSGGLYSPPYAATTATVQATSGAFSAAATVTVSGSAQWNASSDATWGRGR